MFHSIYTHVLKVQLIIYLMSEVLLQDFKYCT